MRACLTISGNSVSSPSAQMATCLKALRDRDVCGRLLGDERVRKRTDLIQHECACVLNTRYHVCRHVPEETKRTNTSRQANIELSRKQVWLHCRRSQIDAKWPVCRGA